MQLDISFAKPIGPYKNLCNMIPKEYCHVEMSFHTAADTFKKQLHTAIEHSHSPARLELLKKRLRNIKGKIIVCFYINWGETVSCRYLSEIITEPYFRPPEEPVYDVIPLKIDVEESEKIINFNLKNIGKPYDYMRAILSLAPITLRTSDLPDKFYCAQLVLYTLKEIGIEIDGDINHQTPLSVYKFLESIKDRHMDTNGGTESDSK
tara:strand:- start:1115 stop:1735 length:621 start_codon:yes stop_codon:yes gene_type:complete